MIKENKLKNKYKNETFKGNMTCVAIVDMHQYKHQTLWWK